MIDCRVLLQDDILTLETGWIRRQSGGTTAGSAFCGSKMSCAGTAGVWRAKRRIRHGSAMARARPAPAGDGARDDLDHAGPRAGPLSTVR